MTAAAATAIHNTSDLHRTATELVRRFRENEQAQIDWAQDHGAAAFIDSCPDAQSLRERRDEREADIKSLEREQDDLVSNLAFVLSGSELGLRCDHCGDDASAGMTRESGHWPEVVQSIGDRCGECGVGTVRIVEAGGAS